MNPGCLPPWPCSGTHRDPSAPRGALLPARLLPHPAALAVSEAPGQCLPQARRGGTPPCPHSPDGQALWVGQDAGPAPALPAGRVQEGLGRGVQWSRCERCSRTSKAQKALGSLQGAGHPRGTELSQRGTSVSQGPCDWETQGGGAGFSSSATCLGQQSAPSLTQERASWAPQPGAWGRGRVTWGRGC